LKHRKFWPLASFAFGFFLDAISLGRIDHLADNLRLLAFLGLLYWLIPLTHMLAAKRIQSARLLKYERFYPLAIQFLFGGLFSAHAIYYFQSASFSQNIIFVILLLSLTLGVEFLENRLSNLYLQLSFLFLVTASFLAFFLPILIGSLSSVIFRYAALTALALIWVMLGFLYYKKLMPHPRESWRIAALPALFCGLLLWLYQVNLIPPVPLSLKHSGIYHRVQKVGNNYRFFYEKAAWWKFWTDQDHPFHFAPGDTIIAFTPIFAPTGLSTDIYHHWMWYNPVKGEWQQYDLIKLEVQGGRDAGYRAYTRKRKISSGELRLEVKTGEGHLLGSHSFEVEKVENNQEYELRYETF